MATICEDCGEELTPDAIRCARCGRPVPDLPVAPAPSAGVPTFAPPVWPPDGPGASTVPYANPTAGPSPEGLDLLMQQHRLEQQERRRHASEVHESGLGAADQLFGMDSYGGETLGDLVAPTRDRDGNIEWDLKYALVGAVIVALVVGLVAAFVIGGFSGSHVSRVS